MSSKMKIAVEQNPYNGTWDVGWKWADDDEFMPGEFTPHFCGYKTRKLAEAEIPGFDERVKKETDEMLQKTAAEEAEEAEQNEEFPNLAYVRAEIAKLGKRGKQDAAFEALRKLDWLLDLDLAEHITWPLPSWAAIKSGRVYGR